MYLKLIVFSVLMYGAWCDDYGSNTIYSYQLPSDSKNKSLNVTINSASYQQFQIAIECYNYDSLKYFEVRLEGSKTFELRNGVQLEFLKCFNNATDSGNYNYVLSRWFNSLPYFNNENYSGYPFKIKLDDYAEMNSDVLFKNFDFRKFDDVIITNLGFSSTKFLNDLHCRRCIFENNGRIDFNHFRENVEDAYQLHISFNKLINLNSDNLKKFTNLKSFEISNFELDDINAFNVPDVFVHSRNLSNLKIEKSKQKVILHEHVFRGLKSIGRIVLQDLQLDYIPKDLLNDLEELVNVDFSSNNIKTVDPNTFQKNKRLYYISFADNPFYTEPHKKLDEFNLCCGNSELTLGNFTAHTFDLLDQLIINPKLRQIRFQSLLIDKFNISEFVKKRTKRDSIVHVGFRDGEPTLDLEHIKTFGNILVSGLELRNKQLDAVIHIPFFGDALCYDCTIIKYLFPYYLERYRNHPGFYFEDSRQFVSLNKLPNACYHLEELFEEQFDKNCPTLCECKYNPLLDKVKIDCTNQKLTEIPQIPYFNQFDKLHSIELHFENNSIGVLSLTNQDAKVLTKISALHFKNNKIKTLDIGEDYLKENIFVLNLCNNPILTTEGRRINLASFGTCLSDLNCYIEYEHPNAVGYIYKNKMGEIDQYLNGLNCN